MVYTYPFSTIKNELVAQPYSVAVGLFSVGVLSYFWFRAKTWSLRCFFFFLILFELCHVYSHTRPHLRQQTLQHLLGYLVLLSTFWTFQQTTRRWPSTPQLLTLLLLFLIDVYCFVSMPFLVSMGTTFLLFVLLFFFYSPWPRKCRQGLVSMVVAIVILMLLFWNESVNCQKMLKAYPFPYHAMIEVVGLYVLIVLGNLLFQRTGQTII